MFIKPCNQRAGSKVYCTAARGLSDAEESFAFFVSAWYVEFAFAIKDTLFAAIMVRLKKAE